MTTKARILVVDDEASLLDSLGMMLSNGGYDVTTALDGEGALKQVEAIDVDLAILDVQLPDCHGIELLRRIKRRSPTIEVIVMTAYGTIPLAVEAMKAGAFYFVAKPFGPEEIQVLVQKALEHRRLRTQYEGLRHKLSDRDEYGHIIGRSKAMQDVFDTIESVARTDVNVMVVGESGTGKELVAKAIHLNSLHAEGPFVSINCAAVPKELMESELFGHTRGAFTGATMERRGLIAAASGGSLLLDEITEMPTELQAKLLRVIEERRYRRVGSDTIVQADFRLISTTNRDVQKAVSEGHLRRDLFYRLSTVLIELPPLRARAEDLTSLCDHFLKEYVAKHNRSITGFSDDAYNLILSHAWPGNVRELEHAIERAVLCARGPRIEARDLRLKVISALDASFLSGPAWPADLTLEGMERWLIRQALVQTQGNKQEAAALLGISRTALYNKLKRYDLESDAEAPDKAQ